VNERLWYWLFGLALSGALTAAIGRTFVEERGPKVIPVLFAVALVLGLLFGWAIDGYVAYARASAEMRL
jgi:uncharacterized membrane protein YfcA